MRCYSHFFLCHWCFWIQVPWCFEFVWQSPCICRFLESWSMKISLRCLIPLKANRSFVLWPNLHRFFNSLWSFQFHIIPASNLNLGTVSGARYKLCDHCGIELMHDMSCHGLTWNTGWTIRDSWGWQMPSWRTSSSNCKAVGILFFINISFGFFNPSGLSSLYVIAGNHHLFIPPFHLMF